MQKRIFKPKQVHSILVFTVNLFILNFYLSAQATSVFSEDSYQEVTYEDLLKEISGQKKQVMKQTSISPLDDVKIHMGLGMMSSITHFNLQSHHYERFQNGMSVSLGIDLFSEQWFAESVFKNYGLTTQGVENLTLRELDLILGFKKNMNNNIGYFVKSGLSNRYLNFSDLTKNITHDENSPHLLLSTGFNIYLTPHMGLSFDISGQSALVQSTSLKNAVEFAFRLNTSL
ncbi:MAG TPA: hypothetical protein PLJ21_11100 [Pseudobdellovibrionaceae bacterium]|nr:hypothetical protein [Pseudobdellovibrionaceae bacterium]